MTTRRRCRTLTEWIRIGFDCCPMTVSKLAFMRMVAVSMNCVDHSKTMQESFLNFWSIVRRYLFRDGPGILVWLNKYTSLIDLVTFLFIVR